MSNKLSHVFAALSCGFAIAVLPVGGKADAATGNVQFRATIAQTNICAILVNNDGRLGVNATQRQLSSKLTGGAAIAEMK
jgi:type 1 fimbria pilin